MAALGDPQTFSIGGCRFLRTFEGMLQWFSRRAETSRRAQELYGSVVAAARQPSFYRDLGVPDTPEGRFELVALHLFLALENLRQSSAERDLVQRTIEAFVTDMDDCMREMGVGDLTVPRKVRRAAAAFYERVGAYRLGLAEKDRSDLEDALAAYVFNEGAADAEGARALACYVRKASSLLSAAAFEQCVLSGELMKLLARNEAEVS